jgi:hypothetical protein
VTAPLQDDRPHCGSGTKARPINRVVTTRASTGQAICAVIARAEALILLSALL